MYDIANLNERGAMPRVYDVVGINLNKGTKRVNSVAPGCTIEYEADEKRYKEERKRVRRTKRNSTHDRKAHAELLEFYKQRESNGVYRRDIEAKPGYTVNITSMADKELNNWNTSKRDELGEVPNGFTIAPAYNKGAYQVVPKSDTDAYKNRK